MILYSFIKSRNFLCCLLGIFSLLYKFTESSSPTELTHSFDNKDSTVPPLLSTSSDALVDPELLEICNGNCSDLPATCYDCQTNNSCKYGETVAFNCQVKNGITCKGNHSLTIDYQCRYCFLTKPNEEHVCKQNVTNCSVTATPRQRVMGECNVKDRVFCLGSRTFKKMMPCSWTSGYRWSTAFALSITVGGFGVDRFYLGYWREGLGKLFSFGGLGVWTIIDVILIGTGYLSPSDGSLYVY